MNQVVIPMQIFIGDTAELRYSFTNTNQKLSQFGKKELKNYKEIPVSAFCGENETRDFSIKKVNLIQTGENNYTISVLFVPWKVGEVQLPSYDLMSALFADESSFNQIVIDFEPVKINSIIEQKNLSSELNAPETPKLLPGTVYGIYFRGIFAILVLIILLVLLIKHKSFNFWLKNQALKQKYRKNKNNTLKNLEKTLKDYENADKDKKFAEDIQKIIRNYLEIRFDYPFKNAAASEIYSKYYEITLGLLSDKKNDCIEKISGIFIRTDFIRYAENFEEKEKLTFAEAEKITDELKNAVLIIETPEPEENKQSEENEEILMNAEKGELK